MAAGITSWDLGPGFQPELVAWWLGALNPVDVEPTWETPP